MFLQSARDITIEVLCEEKSKWVYTLSKKLTHKNIPLLLGRQPQTHCSLSVNRRLLCFLQQEPAAETCYCAACWPTWTRTISKRCAQILPLCCCCWFAVACCCTFFSQRNSQNGQLLGTVLFNGVGGGCEDSNLTWYHLLSIPVWL